MITVHGNAWRTLYGLLAAVGSMLLAALVNLAAPQAEWLVRPAVVMVVVAGLTWSLLHLPAAIYSLGSVIAAAALTIGGSMAACRLLERATTYPIYHWRTPLTLLALLAVTAFAIGVVVLVVSASRSSSLARVAAGWRPTWRTRRELAVPTIDFEDDPGTADDLDYRLQTTPSWLAWRGHLRRLTTGWAARAWRRSVARKSRNRMRAGASEYTSALRWSAVPRSGR